MPYAGSLCWPARFLLYDPAPQATRQGWPALSTCDGEPAYGMPLPIPQPRNGALGHFQVGLERGLFVFAHEHLVFEQARAA